MPIPVKCTSIVRYDKETGKYVYCDNVINVADSRAGEMIECPKCGHSLEVVPPAPTEIKPAADPLSDDAIGLSPPAPPPPSPTVPETPSPKPVDLEKVAPLDFDIDLPPDKPVEKPASSPSQVQQKPKPPPAPAASAPAPSSNQNWTMNAPPQAATNTIQAKVPCINCHTPIERDEVVCPSCGYKQPEDDLPDEEIGFQKWMRGQMAEGTSPMSVLMLIGFLCSICMFSCVAWTFVEYGGLTFMIFVPFLIVGGVYGVIIGVNRRKDEPWPAAIKRVGHPWTLMLLASRAWKWRDARPPFAARKVLDMRDKPITDADLLAIEDLGEYEVLDLEGTAITDEGVLYLRETPAVRFLVILRTETTPEAMRKLQQQKPNIWIWQ